MHSHGPILIALFVTLAGAGCAAVAVEGAHRDDGLGTIEPVAFIIFQSRTPPSYSEILKRTLSDEMLRRGVPAHFAIVPDSGDAKPGVVANVLSDVPGAIIIAPSDGSSRLNGVSVPVYYDVRALRVIRHPGPAVPGGGPNGTNLINDGTGQFTYIWRGRAYARGGFAEGNLRQVALQIVEKLVADSVLRAMP